MFQSKDKQHLSTPTKPATSAKTSPPYTVSSPQLDGSDVLEIFDIDRVCYPGKADGRYGFWLSTEGQTSHQLRLDRKGMYCPYVGGEVGDKEYQRWMINPKRIVQLEFHTEKRLVKISRTYMDEEFILFGFTNGVEDFLRSVKNVSPDTIMTKIES